MTTTIVPGAGAGCLFTQQGVGTTPGFAALDDRRSNSGALQAGVLGSPTLVTAGGVANTPNADFMVTQRNAGVNMSVDVNMPANGFAWVQGDTINGQGIYGIPVHSVNINEAIAAADATNPRIDQLILEIQDNVFDASGGNLARTRVLTGTPTSGATLTNRSGAAALPASCLLLGDVLVPNSSASVPNSNIRDRRKWARGAFSSILRNNAGGDYVVSSATYIVIDATNVAIRIECSGAPVRLVISGTDAPPSTGQGQIQFTSDGVAIGDSQALTDVTQATVRAYMLHRVVTPSAGSHVFAPYALSTTGAGWRLYANANQQLGFSVEELVRQNTANNTVTSG